MEVGDIIISAMGNPYVLIEKTDPSTWKVFYLTIQEYRYLDTNTITYHKSLPVE